MLVVRAGSGAPAGGGAAALRCTGSFPSPLSRYLTADRWRSLEVARRAAPTLRSMAGKGEYYSFITGNPPAQPEASSSSPDTEHTTIITVVPPPPPQAEDAKPAVLPDEVRILMSARSNVPPVSKTVWLLCRFTSVF